LRHLVDLGYFDPINFFFSTGQSSGEESRSWRERDSEQGDPRRWTRVRGKGYFDFKRPAAAWGRDVFDDGVLGSNSEAGNVLVVVKWCPTVFAKVQVTGERS
jgi:hypothetical protein